VQRNAVVTGGGTGIGRAVAERLAHQGLAVTITGRRADVLETAAKEIGAVVVPFDATDPDGITQALPALPDRVDVLVTCAGANTDLVDGPPAPDDLAAVQASWRRNFDANVLSAVLVTNALLPRLADGARIVTLGSVTARSGQGSYGAVKAALEPWSSELAFQLGPRGISVNVVAPGPTEGTDFFHGADFPEARREFVVSRSANRRLGRVEEVADVIAFLTTPAAGHVTGQVIHVSGGMHLGR
jgi:3-oxoacyl-[acyl-carrier protein] reductase